MPSALAEAQLTVVCAVASSNETRACCMEQPWGSAVCSGRDAWRLLAQPAQSMPSTLNVNVLELWSKRAWKPDGSPAIECWWATGMSSRSTCITLHHFLSFPAIDSAGIERQPRRAKSCSQVCKS